MARDGRNDKSTALVLSGGGARGAYQAGVLAGIAERLGGDVPFPVVTGVSAGGINAASLASARIRGREGAMEAHRAVPVDVMPPNRSRMVAPKARARSSTAANPCHPPAVPGG